MELNQKVTKLEDEIKVLKNEVQAVLLDLRESYLTRENPFAASGFSPAAVAAQPIIINQPSQPAAKQSQAAAAEEEIPEAEISEAAVTDEADEAELAEPDNGTEPEYKPKPTAAATAPKEVKRVRRPEIEAMAQFKSMKTTDIHNGKTGLATIAGLAQWVAESTKRLGRERVKVILEISEMMGHLTLDIKQVLVKLIDITPDGYSGEVTTRDYLVTLIELANILGKSDKSEVALLSILYQENDHR